MQPLGELAEMLKKSPSVQAHLNQFAVPTRSPEDTPLILGATFALSWGITEIARIFGGKRAVEVLLDSLEFALKNSPTPEDEPIEQVPVPVFLELFNKAVNSK